MSKDKKWTSEDRRAKVLKKHASGENPARKAQSNVERFPDLKGRRNNKRNGGGR